MVARLVGAALRHRAAVFLLAAGLLMAGFYAARTAPLDVFPEFAPPIVEVQVEAPGLAPEDVEALVTRPLERALAGAPGVATLRSSSIAGLSVVTAVYRYGTDPYRARQVVIERLALAAEQLPPGTRPAVSPLSAALSTILAIGLRAGPSVSPLELRDLAEWTIRPRLLAVPGVANVVIYGGGIRQVQLTTTPERLLPAGVRVDQSMFRQASFVTHALGNLRRALLAGVVLVLVVLVLFTGSKRAAFVSVVAIPLSLLAAVTVLRAAGATLNVMVLGGLAIAVGEVVDDAIIDVENAWRRLRAAPASARADDVVLAASVEVRSAVVYATVMVALVFLPVFLLGGLEGALFRPLATAYVLATLASLVVALTVTPALAAVLLPGAVARRTAPPWLLSALRARYERALGAALARPAPVIAGSVAALAAALALTPLLRLEFLPEFHETNFVMHMTGAPGVGLDESARVGAATARTLLAVPGVRSVAQVIGRSTLSEDTFGPERSEMMVQLEPGVNAAAVSAELRARTAEVTGFAFDLKQFRNERIEELLGGVGAALVVRLRGADLPSLEQAATTVSERLAVIPGVPDLHAPGAVAAAPLPAGVYAEVGGEYAAAAAARARLVGLGALALLGIFVLLVVDFGSPRLAGLTMVNVPLAFVGGLAAVLLGAGGRLSLGAIVGFVTVFGITIRNGIVLVAHFLHAEEARGGPLDRAAVVAAAAARVAPSLIAALTPA